MYKGRLPKKLHIGVQIGASPSRIEGFREFEADLSDLLSYKMKRTNNI